MQQDKKVSQTGKVFTANNPPQKQAPITYPPQQQFLQQQSFNFANS